MRKRILCFILALSFCMMPFIAQATEMETKDVVFLQDMDILEEAADAGLYSRRFDYTREQFAKALALMTVNYEPPLRLDPSIKDASMSNYWGYIDFCVAHGFMSLDENGYFHPADYITQADAIRGLVSVLNYDILAEEKGGTEQAYMTVAAQIGITRGVTIEDPASVKIPELAKLIMNAMETSPAVMPGEVVYHRKPTLLEQKNLEKKSGRILANQNVALSIDPCAKGHVNIDGKIYESAIVIEDIAVGAIVTYYTQTINGETKVVSVYAGDEILTLDASDVESVTFSKNYIEIAYDDEEVAKINTTAFVKVNKGDYRLSAELFNVFENGTISMRDSDEDGYYDVVYMEIYKTEVAEGIGATSIITKYANQNIQLSKFGDNLEVYREGLPVDISLIKAGNVISLAADNFSIVDGKLVMNYDQSEWLKVQVSVKQVTGTITQTSGSDTIYIDGIAYKIGTNLSSLINSGKKAKLAAGLAVVLYLDRNNNIVDYEKDATADTMEYGYLIDGIMFEQGLNKYMMLKILNEAGEITAYRVADKFILDGLNKASDNLIFSDIGSGVDFNNRQLIRFRLQGGVIKEIDTLQVSSAETADTSLAKHYEVHSHKSDPLYNSSNAPSYRLDGFVYQCLVNAKTVIFRVPFLTATEVNDTQFTRIARSSLIESTGYSADGYDLDNTLFAKCLVVYENAATTAFDTATSYTFMVNDVYEGLNSDGQPEIKVELLGRTAAQREGELLALSIASDVVCKDNMRYVYGNNSPANGPDLPITSLKKGDLVRYLTNADGKINTIERVFTPTKDEPLKCLATGGLKHGYMRVYDVYNEEGVGDYFSMCAAEDMSAATKADYRTFKRNTFKTLYIYNVKSDTITSTLTMTDCTTYKQGTDTKAFVCMSYSDVSNVYVYQWD